MNTEEINKVNDLYKQLDVLTVENKTLKDQLAGTHDHSEILGRLKSIEERLEHAGEDDTCCSAPSPSKSKK